MYNVYTPAPLLEKILPKSNEALNVDREVDQVMAFAVIP